MRAHIKLPVWQPFLLKSLTSPVLPKTGTPHCYHSQTADTPEQSMSYFPFFFLKYGATAEYFSFAVSACMGHGFITAGEATPYQAGWERAWKSYVVGRSWCLLLDLPWQGSLVQASSTYDQLGSCLVSSYSSRQCQQSFTAQAQQSAGKTAKLYKFLPMEWYHSTSLYRRTSILSIGRPHQTKENSSL